MTNECFLVFSDDFGEHPTSCQHIFRYISKDHKILWVNTFLRAPTIRIRDLKKILLKAKKMFHGTARLSDIGDDSNHIHVIQPPMLPFLAVPVIRKINRMLICSKVKKQLQRLGMDRPVLVITAPNACDYIGCFNEKLVVHYCVDDFSEWPGLNRKIVHDMEQELIDRSDLHIASSEKLYEKIISRSKKTHLLTHGVDYELFRQVADKEHELLKNIPVPRVGYFGLFDERIDQDIIAGLAQRIPDVSFVITGDVAVEITRLRKMKNIYFTGNIPYDELPLMANGWDVCILPYKINKLTDAIQPLKIKEYLATGNPVISTPIKEALRIKEHVIIAGTAEAWERELMLYLKRDRPLDLVKRNAFLQEESWDKKARLFLRMCLANIQ